MPSPLSESFTKNCLAERCLAGKYKEAEKNVAYLEKLSVSDPIRSEEYPYLINTSYGRARLALAANDLKKPKGTTKKPSGSARRNRPLV